MLLDVTYYSFAVVAMLSALGVVFSTRPVYCLLSLVVTMLSLAGIFVIIQSPFVALVQVLVYAGAILVLFLYVIMLINPRQIEPIVEIVITRRLSAVLLALMFFLLTLGTLLRFHGAVPKDVNLTTFGVKDIAARMLTDYMLPFELTSVLLLIAIIGAVVIVRRN